MSGTRVPTGDDPGWVAEEEMIRMLEIHILERSLLSLIEL